MRNSERGSATLLIALGIAGLATGMGVTVVTSSVLQNRAQGHIVDAEESFYSGEITAVQVFERKKAGLVSSSGEFTVAIDNRNNVAVAGTPAPVYDPATYTIGTAVPLSLTTRFDPSPTFIRRYSPTNLKNKYAATGPIGSTYCGKMSFSGGLLSRNTVATCLYEKQPVTARLTANGSTNPAPISAGSSVAIHWESTFAQECHLDNGITDTTLSGDVLVPNIAPPPPTHTFSVTCTRPGGLMDDSASAVVSVSFQPPLVCDLKANGNDGPMNLPSNTTADLTWTVNDPAAACILTPGAGTTSPVHSAPITVPTNFTLTCTRNGGALPDDACADAVAVTPVVTPFTVDIKANGMDGPVNVTSGGTVSLSWTTSRPTTASCVVGPAGFTGAENPGVTSPAITSPTDFILTCSSGTDSAQDAVHVNPTVGPPLVADLKVNGSDGPVTVANGTAVSLSWTSSPPGATCNVSPGGLSGASGTGGSAPLTTDTVFTLNCSDSTSQTASDQVPVRVQANPPTADIKANQTDTPAPVNWEGHVTLSWTSTNTTSCTVTSNRTPSDSFSGVSNPGVQSAKLMGATTYTLSCNGPNGQATDSVCIGTRSPPPITFEDHAPREGKQISTQWQASHHVIFSILGSNALPVLARIAKPGQKVDDPRAWLCAKCPDSKKQNRLWGTKDYAIGEDWALTLPDATYNDHPDPLLVTYEYPVSEVTGFVADIDDEETWTVTPRDANGHPYPLSVWTKTAPKGYGPDTWNGEMVPFKVTRPRAEIYSIVVDGSKGRKFFGFGFDRFSTGDSFCGP